MRPVNSYPRAPRGRRIFIVLLALLAFTTITATHGVMPEGEMHHEGAVECLATTADVSSVRTCTATLETATARETFASSVVGLVAENDPQPTPTGAYARHGPSDLQVFRT
ncbi:MAG: hypothetical protein ACSLFF_05780 [Solirubrobacterales bacterium]